MKKLIAGLGLGTALAFAAPTTAEAQGPVVTGGLVNITIVDLIDGDVLSNNNVALGVALQLAANVCGVAVNVLALQLPQGPVTCNNGAQSVTISPTQRQR